MTIKKTIKSKENTTASNSLVYVIASPTEENRLKRIAAKRETQDLMQKEGLPRHPVATVRRESVSIGKQHSVQANTVKAVVLANADNFELTAKVGTMLVIPYLLFSLYLDEVRISVESDVRRAEVKFKLPGNVPTETLTFTHLCVVPRDSYTSVIVAAHSDNQDEHEADLMA
jgi:hypothetical protein